jgi:hypothetical protein
MRIKQLITIAAISASLMVMVPAIWAQNSGGAVANGAAGINITIEQPDAERTKNELSQLLDHYPPSLRNVLALDPSLLSNQTYVAPYPALAGFLNTHPEIARNPSFYISHNIAPPREEQILDLWRDMLNGVAIFAGFGMAIGLIIWLIRTLVDYRRWNRLTKIQTEVHTKLLDRFTANEDLLAYMQSPAGMKFLESSPISLDAGPRSVGAPLGRILWSVQAGLVVAAAGIGLQIVSARITDESAQPLHALGVLGVALGVGFVVSAVVSYLISRRLGLIEPAARTPITSAQH